VREHFAAARRGHPRAARERLTFEPPTLFGPDHDRSALHDVNTDLFPKDEFLIGGKSW
jgi:hypothetical protein